MGFMRSPGLGMLDNSFLPTEIVTGATQGAILQGCLMVLLYNANC